MRCGGKPPRFSDCCRHVGLLFFGSPARYRTAVFRLSAGCSAFELRERYWCFVADSNRGSPACRVGALAAKLTKRFWCSLQDSNLRMSVCNTDALAAWRSERMLVHPGGLESPFREAAASEVAASAVSPRVHSWCRNGRSNAGFRLTKAVPCHWTILAQNSAWCWLEDSNLPPLAYEASALPDELSQLLAKLPKGSRRRSRVRKRACLNGPEIRRRVQFSTFTMSKSATPTAP